MANQQDFCNSAKVDLLNGGHAFGASFSRTSPYTDSFKAALYESTGNLGPSTTAYSTTNEVSGSNYTAGGEVISSWIAPADDSGTAHTTPSGNITYSNVTLTTNFDAVLIYNSDNSNKAVSVHTFGNQTVTAGDFTLTMPTNDGTTGLIRIA